VDIRRPDRWLMFFTIVLVGFGALMIYSSTSVITPVMAKKQITDSLFYFKRHITTIMIALAAAGAAYSVKADRLGKFSPLLLFFSLAMLVLVFTKLGVTAGGARRWIRLWPSTFQPSELVKLSMVIFLAWYLSRDFFREGGFLTSMAVPVAVMGAFQVIFLKQPDFGAAATLGVITVGMLFVAGVRLRHLAVLLVFLIPVAYKLVQEPYRLRRVTSFLDPWADPQGSGFQLVQSFIALGRGGLGGVGLGQSMQKLAFLPEMHTDFIFSIIGEELGLIAAASVVALFGALFVRGVQIAGRMEAEYSRGSRGREGGEIPVEQEMAERSRARFRYLLAYGISLMIAMQGLVNFCVVTGLLPTKGLPLPFISYGGSSLLVNLIAVGILLRLSKGETPENKHDRFAGAIGRKKARRAVYGEGL
jgi:cell division protein FtsW